ncbi:hypothetical protein EYE40_00885 [Glaciihabitans arcticus]|uniref:Uncharacterized protein n=1 Tax=Glaciihabitans arcticus TaxID=2668039 RepID=A0A4Q9GSK1_9MICO|nr:hypothetical protein [Glaciihabitans arcticus]TBN56067.1 hypothetical protein EYE40_00885 [Glaciihabitans arcticus]
MTTTATITRSPTIIPATSTWHRPLLWLAAAMGVLAVIALVGSLVDTREVLGVNLWIKPLKFAISVGIYAVSLSWVIGLLQKRARLGRIIGTVSVIGLVIEMVIIVGAAAAGLTSHFNVSTPFHAALWSTMAVSIVVVWAMTLVAAIALLRTDLGDPARSLAIRAGAVLAVIGMGLAFLMTSPSAQQLASFQGIAGAHAVGVADGGPGLFLLGWSTVAGDLRIPHFVGMHALQVFPLLVVGLELLASRVPRLADGRVRARLVLVAIVSFSSTLAVLTWQALSGQSIVQPSGAVLVAGVAVAVASLVAAIAVLFAPTRSAPAVADPA